MKRIGLGLVLIVSTLNAGCGGSSPSGASSSSYDLSSGAVVASAVSSAAASSDDSAGSPVAWMNKTPILQKYDYLSLLLPKASAASCVTGATIKGLLCTGGSSNIMTLPLASCTVGGATWTGSYTLTYDAGATCTAAKANGLLHMGATHDVTFTSPAPGVTRTGPLGAYVTTTSDSSGFSTPESGGIEITCNSADCSSTTGRTVNILGVHRQQYSASSTIVYDHTFNTSTPFTITGTLPFHLV